jgi:hypothetical protein
VDAPPQAFGVMLLPQLGRGTSSEGVSGWDGRLRSDSISRRASFSFMALEKTVPLCFESVLGAPNYWLSFAKLPSCLIGIEACGSAHHWARELTRLGHTVRLMAPIYVKPYLKRGKNDAVDAEGCL